MCLIVITLSCIYGWYYIMTRHNIVITSIVSFALPFIWLYLLFITPC